jgi:hypothetical protein
MEEFFEAWIETIFERTPGIPAGQLHVGRQREMVSPILWNPPYE